jgi:2-amino-4-hydroxy-6-hydroxymethyldihydropteridine diphosphokinase
MTTTVYIALGSNLGDRRRSIALAIKRIQDLDGTSVLSVSSIIETEPVGPAGQGPYMNAVIAVETGTKPRALLEQLLAIELVLGRDRSSTQRWGPRIIDLDILLFGDQVIDEPGLEVPHPRMYERRFVLIPLVQIAPDISLPNQSQTPRALLDALHEA